MTRDALVVLQALFGPIWRLFTSWNIPGTHMSPADWALFALFFVVLIRMIGRFVGDASVGQGDGISFTAKRVSK